MARPASVTGSVEPPPATLSATRAAARAPPRLLPEAAAAKLDQIKDLYLTAEAIGEDALDKHFDQVSQRQRELISEFFERSEPRGGDQKRAEPRSGSRDSLSSAMSALHQHRVDPAAVLETDVGEPARVTEPAGRCRATDAVDPESAMTAMTWRSLACRAGRQ